MGKVKKIPLRKCVGCQQMKGKKELLRIVKISETQAVTDTTGKMNGRGAYLCFDKNCFRQALRSRALQRSLGMTLSAEAIEEIGKELEREIKPIETG